MVNTKKAHTTKMSTNGQLVIPVKLRDAAGLKPGMTFLVANQAGTIVLTPQAPVDVTGLKEDTAHVEDIVA